MKGPHPQSHVADRSSGHVTNQKHFIFTFTKCKVHKLTMMVKLSPKNIKISNDYDNTENVQLA